MTEPRSDVQESAREPGVEYHDGAGPLKPVCVGQWCCGCTSHPIGKPWGWNYMAWDRHWDECHPLPEQPKTEYRDEDFA